MSFFPLLLAASLASGNAEFEQASVNAAADIALGQLNAQITDKGLATNFLERAMLENPASYRTRSEAEALCRELYRAELERVYRAKEQEILRELGTDRAPTEPDAKFLSDAASRHFALDFEKDRAAACAAQAANIALRVKPDEADLESKSEDEARAWLTDRIANAKGMNVFEENVKYISEQIVDPVLADARKERKRQQEYLMRTRCEAYAPEALAKEIETNLRKNVAERNRKCDNPLKAWNVFPATLRVALTNAVERRLVAIVAKEADTTPFALDTNAVRETIFASPATHRELAASEKIFRENYAKDLTECAIIKAEQSAPAAEREAFGAYIRAHAEADDLARAVDTRLRRDTMPQWRIARAAIAKAEADRLWPMLADHTWYPSADLADRMAARNDYTDAVRNWRGEPSLDQLAGAGSALEESDAAADKSVAAAFDLARNAINAQRNILSEVSPRVLEAAKSGSSGLFASTPDVTDVADMLTKEVEKSWKEKRLTTLWPYGERPANADDQHKEIFPSVRREIELVARQILEQMEKPVEAAVPTPEQKPEPKPEEPPPEETPPEETPPEEEEPKEELCTIEIEMKGTEVTVQAKRGENVIAERKAKATVQGLENAVREVGAIVGREIFKLK